MSKIMEIPPGFTKSLSKNAYKRMSIDDTYMQEDESKNGSVNELSGKRYSLRERVSPDLFIPVDFRLRPRAGGRPPAPKQRSDASQPIRRGRGRPRKQKSDESPASQPLRSRPGRPRKKRSDAAEGSPPALPSGSTREVPVQVSVTASAPELAASPPGPPLGSSSYRPLEIPFNSEEEQRETKVKLNPLFRLMKKPPKANHTPEILDEELKKVILKVEYLLVQKLLASGNNDVDCMVHQANTTFTYLKGFGVDYYSFYRDVTEYIEHRYNLHDAERRETLLSFSVWGGNYLNAMRSANDVDEVIVRTRGEHEKVKEKMGILKRQIGVLQQELAHFEHEDERLERDIMKYKEEHKVAEAKRQELGIQLEAAQAKLREIKQHKNAALIGIESTTRRLESTYR